MASTPFTTSTLLNRLLARGKFRHVQVLLKLAELGSVQRTADAIGMTQSSVTQTLAYLERLLELPLFDRHARGVRPTAACRDLLPVARQLLLGLTEGAEVVVARQRRGQGVVRLATSVAALNGLLLETLPRFAERHPQIELHLSEAEGDDQLLAITRQELDLVACRRPPVVPEGWVFTPLLDDRFAVLCGGSHAAARVRRWTWDKLAAQTWLLPPAGTAARERFDELAAGFPQPPATHPLVTRSPSALVWMLLHEALLAFLPRNVVRPHVESGQIVELDVQPGSPIEPLGLLRPAAGVSEAAELLCGELLQRFAPQPPLTSRGRSAAPAYRSATARR
ncbi:MAG: LysR family transcriptional regulator [Rubrivivax sp.]